MPSGHMMTILMAKSAMASELYNGDTVIILAFPEKLRPLVSLLNVRAPGEYALIPGYNLM